MDSVYAPKTGLYLPGTTGNYISTPDHADLDITGDLEIVLLIALNDWTPASTSPLAGKDASSNRSWILWIDSSASGNPKFFWTEDGTSLRNVISTAAIPATNGQYCWLKMTFDVNVSSSHIITFYTSLDTTMDESLVSWTQLGSALTAAGGGVTSIFSGSAALTLGTYTTTATPMTGNIKYFSLKNGINGTLVAEFDASKCKPRYRDSTGKIWSITGSDVVTERVYHD